MLRHLPSANELLARPPLKSLVQRFSHNVVVSQVGRFLDGMRSQMQSTATTLNIPTPSELAQRIADWIAAQQPSDVRPIINATGILLHPELGGPPLAAEATHAVAGIAGSYAAADFDVVTGDPAPGTKAVEQLLIRLTGAEAATVVCSQAGAAVLTLAAVAAGREIIVARGQLVEIPGSHRLDELIAASGAELREVGAANCTRLEDYAQAISNRSGALLHIHTHSPGAGSSQHPPVAELAELAKQRKIPLIDDLGVGSLVELSSYGIVGEAVAGDCLRAGAGIVLMGGDRLLGGPPCGLIAGRRELVQAIEKHPLSPALRADKLTMAALAATLHLYQDLTLAEREVPLLSLLATPLDNLKNRADRLAPQIVASGLAQVEVVPGQGQVTTSIPGGPTIPSWCLALTPLSGKASALARAMRCGKVPVIGRVEENRLLLDLRTVLPRQDIELAAAIVALATARLPPQGALLSPGVE